MAQEDYTGVGKCKIEICLCCNKSKDAEDEMFFAQSHRGFCYDCYSDIPGCIPERQNLRYLKRMSERRVGNG